MTDHQPDSDPRRERLIDPTIANQYLAGELTPEDITRLACGDNPGHGRHRRPPSRRTLFILRRRGRT